MDRKNQSFYPSIAEKNIRSSSVYASVFFFHMHNNTNVFFFASYVKRDENARVQHFGNVSVLTNKQQGESENENIKSHRNNQN